MSQAKYYILNNKVSFEEDGTHEFKGHKNISVEEIPAWRIVDASGCEKQTRTSVSR